MYFFLLPVKIIDPDNIITTYVYNEHNEIIIIQITDGGIISTERTMYDNMGRKVKIATPLEYRELSENLNTDNYTGRGTTYEYDSIGNLIIITNSQGEIINYA